MEMSREEVYAVLEQVSAEARAAGKIILAAKHADDLEVTDKSLGSSVDTFDPVTIADMKSNAYLCTQLHTLFPSFGLLTEEKIEERFFPEADICDSVKKAIETWNTREYAWLIDPLDGTKEFVQGTENYCVLIGLLHKTHPIGGIMYLPEKDEMIFGGICGVYHNAKPFTRTNDAKVFVGAIHEGITLDGYELKQRPSCLGISVLDVIKGTAHAMCYAGGKSSLWDTCASQALLEAVGGTMTDRLGEPLLYTSATLKNTRGVIASSSNHEALVNACASYTKNQ